MEELKKFSERLEKFIRKYLDSEEAQEELFTILKINLTSYMAYEDEQMALLKNKGVLQ